MPVNNEFFPNEEVSEALRVSLIRYLRRLGSKTAEDLAHETVVRVLEKFKAGCVIANVSAYSRGIARNVHLESMREGRTVPLTADLEATSQDNHAELIDHCLKRCRKCLPREERKTIKLYYIGEGQTLIENRRKLAETLGISVELLRLHVLRIRRRLELCIQDCMKRDKGI